jgi:hypothetical protein
MRNSGRSGRQLFAALNQPIVSFVFWFHDTIPFFVKAEFSSNSMVIFKQCRENC